MKKMVLLAVVVLFAASVAFAQGGSIGVFADPAGTNCNLADVAGLKQYYVVHVNSPGAAGCQFRAKMPTCMTGAMWLSDNIPFSVKIGDTQAGVAIGFGGCKPTPNLLATISVFAQGLSGPCCRWYVDADPGLPSGEIEISDCGFNTIYATGGQGIINSNETCNCNVPSEDTTWGQLKALYE